MKNKKHSKTKQNQNGRSADRASALDPDKMVVTYKPMAKMECTVQEGVLKILKTLAQEDGQPFDAEGQTTGEMCDPLWLRKTLRAMQEDLCLFIDEVVSELSRPGEDREELVGKIFFRVLQIRATRDINAADNAALLARLVRVVQPK